MAAPRNRTTRVAPCEREQLLKLVSNHVSDVPLDRVVHGDMISICRNIPPESVDLLIFDPPYNLRKTFGVSIFDRRADTEYQEQFREWLTAALPTLKRDATVYICAEWRTSALVHSVLTEHLCIRNRITWEREKGRAAQTNWKNTSEDIWFCTKGETYRFYPDRVRTRRPVIAPYRDESGQPKDWKDHEDGAYRDTAPSNLWTDITIPFWSMPENTDHPTQKPEKLIAKLVLASSDKGDVILDPFLGSGTTAVVAKKLERRWRGIEIEEEYCALAQKRISGTAAGATIQGYRDGVFWPRNSLGLQKKGSHTSDSETRLL